MAKHEKNKKSNEKSVKNHTKSNETTVNNHNISVEDMLDSDIIAAEQLISTTAEENEEKQNTPEQEIVQEADETTETTSENPLNEVGEGESKKDEELSSKEVYIAQKSNNELVRYALGLHLNTIAPEDYEVVTSDKCTVPCRDVSKYSLRAIIDGFKTKLHYSPAQFLEIIKMLEVYKQFLIHKYTEQYANKRLLEQYAIENCKEFDNVTDSSDTNAD